jgi:hypothetical protein
VSKKEDINVLYSGTCVDFSLVALYPNDKILLKEKFLMIIPQCMTSGLAFRGLELILLMLCHPLSTQNII